jgi:hypothetical protein
MLTKDQVESYREKGYLGVEGVFDAGEVAELQRVTDEFVDKSPTIRRTSTWSRTTPPRIPSYVV